MAEAELSGEVLQRSLEIENHLLPVRFVTRHTWFGLRRRRLVRDSRWRRGDGNNANQQGTPLVLTVEVAVHLSDVSNPPNL